MAQCVSIDLIGVSQDKDLKRLSSKKHIEAPKLTKPKPQFDEKTLLCVPDGKTYCHYSKDKSIKFSLPCECALYQENHKIDPDDEKEDDKIVNIGYCPIPREEHIRNATTWIRKMNI